ncbi:uncharacterized protein N7496_007511 [Penicillium cataractarum]|uniref:Xylanolytic transcriptional activator regulatory domain-containing protein n=1 Tax=Penicillium cataractarum TaxID=2100454 RepID=A0A9W9S684_9EURO|nr:uncharacterized protein N7496_007511 [Penicillium cataractarum]KAJ5371419.1 hypothetical protein N7496_007511 [Penicillium cataractarum]
MLARHIRLSLKDGHGHSYVAANNPSSVTEPDGESHDSLETRELSSSCPPAVQVGDEGLSAQLDLAGHSASMGSIQNLPWNEDDALDFLWDDSFPFSEVLPARFFDTNLSLVDISQQYQNSHLGFEETSQTIDQRRPVTDSSLRSSAAHISAAPIRPSFPEPQHLFIESDTTREAPLIAAVDEIDPSQNRQLKGNFDPSICPWKIAPSDYATFSQDIKELSHLLPESFCLPSRHTLSRFLEGYFRGFHDHMPFIHIPSFSLLSHGPELILSLAAVGAFYRFENAKGYTIYHAARTLINRRLEQRDRYTVSNLTKASPGFAGTSSTHDGPQSFATSNENEISQTCSPENEKRNSLRLLQGLIVLMTLASWGDRSVIGDSLAMSGQVALLVRELGISASGPGHETSSWQKWVEQEEHRRTLWVAYYQFNLQSIAFNVPPMILNQEVLLTLPACGEEWKARDAQEWTRMRTFHTPDSRNFQHVLGQLYQGHQIHKPNAISAFANYVLIHGLLQEIFFARNTASFEEHKRSLLAGFVQTMESALQAWQNSWEATYESTLDPLSPRGPLGFNATALVRLAYIRLNSNIGPHRQLNTRNPTAIAHALLDGRTAVYQRSPYLDRAVLQCIHALSIPVRSGIHFVARTKLLNWSMQHSLCSLECAFLLNHWLQEIALCIERSGVESIRDDERKLLRILYCLVREADLTELPDWADDNASAVRRLAACTARLWAETFKGFHIFQISDVIGESLEIIAGILEVRVTPST